MSRRYVSMEIHPDEFVSDVGTNQIRCTKSRWLRAKPLVFPSEDCVFKCPLCSRQFLYHCQNEISCTVSAHKVIAIIFPLICNLFKTAESSFLSTSHIHKAFYKDFLIVDYLVEIENVAFCLWNNHSLLNRNIQWYSMRECEVPKHSV